MKTFKRGMRFRVSLIIGIVNVFLICVFAIFGINVMPWVMLINFPFSLFALASPFEKMPEAMALGMCSFLGFSGWKGIEYMVRRSSREHKMRGFEIPLKTEGGKTVTTQSKNVDNEQ